VWTYSLLGFMLKHFDVGICPPWLPSTLFCLFCLKRGRTNMADEVYDEMLHTYDATPDICTYNVLIRGFCKNSMVDEGFRFCNEITRFNCDPDVVTCLLMVCVGRGRSELLGI